jgi:hypothetical protein
LPNSNAYYPRYDAIVLAFDPSINYSYFSVTQGVASSNPVRPTPRRVEDGTYELHLYHVYRPAGSSVVTAENVEDMRGDLNYCGYMVDDVSAFDESKFLSKKDYDQSGSVAQAGGITKYVQANAIPINQKGAANGVATLDESRKIPKSQIPGIVLNESCTVDDNETNIEISEPTHCVNKQYGDLTFFDFFVTLQINENTDDNTYNLYCVNLMPPPASRVVSIPFVTTNYVYMGIAYLSRRTTSSTNVKLKFVGDNVPGRESINVWFNGFYANKDYLI